MRAALLAVACWTLNSCCLPIFRNPHDAAYPVAFRTLRVVTYINYVFISPFLLVFTKNFFLDFFLNVQVVRTDDLHLLQFLTKPALNMHNFIYLLIV